MAFNSAVSSSTADMKSRIWKGGLVSGVVVSREGKSRNMAIWTIEETTEPIRNCSSKKFVGGAYDFVTPVPEFLARSRLEAPSNVHKFVMEMLDGRISLFGVVGRRVQWSVKTTMWTRKGSRKEWLDLGSIQKRGATHRFVVLEKAAQRRIPTASSCQYTQGLYGTGPGLRG